MEEKTQQSKPSQAQQPRPCPQDCGKCSPWQQMFCCTKMVFELSKSLQEARQEVATLRVEVEALKTSLPARVEELSNPTITQ